MNDQIVIVRNSHAREKVCPQCGKRFLPNLLSSWPWKRGAKGKPYCSRKCMKEALDKATGPKVSKGRPESPLAARQRES